MTPTAQSAAALFERLTGSAPERIWSAPGRANLIGEHTDYNEGFVLPFAIEHRTYAAVGRRSDGIIRVVSTFDPNPVEVAIVELQALFGGDAGEGVRSGSVPEWAAYPLGVAWAALAADGQGATQIPGVDIAIASDVPIGAGLSSSAAIEGATAGALDDLWGLGLTPLDMAKIGRTAENQAVGAPTGIMDQVASIMGQTDAATFLDCRTLETQAVDLGFAREHLALLVIDTQVSHSHSTGGYRDRREACERGAAALGVPALRDLTVGDLDRARAVLDEVTFRRVAHIVTENQRVLDTVEALRAEGPRAIGGLLVASHVSMRDDFEISVPELDTAVESALEAGAVGARMTGGGFGGAAIALVDEARLEQTREAVADAFARAGFRAPNQFTVVPSHGVLRDA
ncbi:galactokinase [Microbacterium excoecariae]|uniref:galactokinase n=1 Tax=Microbacterium excoecariae TaxID=2715210 RepID=UPI00140C39E4|nr:galactokinase [Microbacterium excoecariae]NHI15864.1 galactokinase [Microbacterium excoecariae]